MQRSVGSWVLALALLGSIVHSAVAEEGVIGGVDVGAAVPVSKLRNRTEVGAALSPFMGYMLNDYLGLTGTAQVVGLPNKDRPGRDDSGGTWALEGLAGPRLALPFDLGKGRAELYGTWQGGVVTGLTGDTVISRTSWGYSTGAGLNIRVTDELLVGAFGRYNWVDQRVEPDHNVQFVTGGLSLTYNVAPPAPAVAQAPPPPRPAPAPAAKKKIVLRGVHFDFDKATLRPDAKPILDAAVDTLKQEGNIRIVVEGHTDGVGSDAYNEKLSLRRASAVRDYLVRGGIAASRLQVEGLGESHPVATNDTEDGRAQNRRVELRIRD